MMDINKTADLDSTVWVGFDGGLVTHYADSGDRYKMLYGMATSDDKRETVDVPRSVGFPPVTLGTMVKSKSHSRRGQFVGKLVNTRLRLRVIQHA